MNEKLGPAIQETIKEISYVVRTNKNMTPAEINKRHGVPMAFSNLFFSKLRDYFRAKEWRSSDYERIEQELIDVYIYFLEEYDEKESIINGLSFILRRDSAEVTKQYEVWIKERNLRELEANYVTIRNITESTMIPHLARKMEPKPLPFPLQPSQISSDSPSSARTAFEGVYELIMAELSRAEETEAKLKQLKEDFALLQRENEELKQHIDQLSHIQSNMNIMVFQGGNTQLGSLIMEKIKEVIDIPSSFQQPLYHMEVAASKEK